jgi:hypothetical protein
MSKIMSNMIGPSRAPQTKNLWANEMELMSSGEFKKQELQVMKENNIPLNNLGFRMGLRKSNFERDTTPEQKQMYKTTAKRKKKENESFDISSQ